VIADLVLHALLGLVPVSCFLAALVYLDSYKLIPLRWVLGVIVLGAGAAILSYPINVASIDWLQIDFVSYTRYVSPVIEEALKASILVVLVRHNRIGFLVDAAIFGFAAGAGFALFEALFYLQALPDAHMGTWIVRGFGTAIMHGGATAIFAVVSEALAGQNPTRGYAIYLPGFVGAVVVHSIFNHFFFAPIINTLLILVFLPLLLAIVFQQSQKSVSDWLGMGFDADTELLELINSGEFSSAKGLLMMRESGFMDKTGEETKAKLEELKFLESSIGTTGLLAIQPFMRMSQEDLWQFYMLSN